MTTDPGKHEKDSPEEFPGYPHYPSEEDITKQGERIDPASGRGPDAVPPEDPVRGKDSAGEGGTREDSAGTGLDDTDTAGAPLNETGSPFGGDLDVPGAADDDAMEDIGEEDEENNYYSLGGDRQPE